MSLPEELHPRRPKTCQEDTEAQLSTIKRWTPKEPSSITSLASYGSNRSALPPPLSKWSLFAYGCGTVITDATATVWFTYLLIYLQRVKNLDPTYAGIVLLAGQIADALFTPLAGTLSDKTTSRWGRRKPWLLGGSLCIIVSYQLMFTECLPCYFSDLWWLPVLYYSLAASIFNCGWASVCVCHMSLVPELTPVENERVLLNSVRFGFTVCSQLGVYAMAWISFKYVDDPVNQYRYLSIAIVVIGSLAMCVCLMVLPCGRTFRCDLPVEQGGYSKGNVVDPEEEEEVNPEENRTWKDYFCMIRFYQIGFIYMCTRLVVVLQQTTIPFYVEDAAGMGTTAIAQIPLFIQLASLPTTFLLKRVTEKIGLKVGYTLGAFICCVAFTALYFLPPVNDSIYYQVSIYPVSILVGVGTAAVAVYAMSMEADLIGVATNSGAFVYGSFGFLEKMSGGLVIFALEHYRWLSKDHIDLVRHSTCTIPVAASVLAILVTLTTQYRNYIQNDEDFDDFDIDDADACCCNPGDAGTDYVRLDGDDKPPPPN